MALDFSSISCFGFLKIIASDVFTSSYTSYMVFQFQFLWGEEEKWKQTTDDFMVAKCKRSFMDYEEKQDSGG